MENLEVLLDVLCCIPGILLLLSPAIIALVVHIYLRKTNKDYREGSDEYARLERERKNYRKYGNRTDLYD